MKMIIKPTYVFSPNNGQDSKKFDTPEKLFAHIKKYDYMREYYKDDRLTGRVMRGKGKGFSLFVRFKFEIEGIPFESRNFHRSDFYIGQSAVIKNNEIQVTTLHHPTRIEEGLHEKYTVCTQDCVIDSETLKQIYPPVDNFEDSKLAKWIKHIESMKYKVEKIK